MQCPTLLGAQPESPECKQFVSAQKDVEEEEGGATSALDAEPDASMGEETEASGHSPWVPSARGTAKGIGPCKGSIPGHVENFEGLRISILVSRCFERLLKRISFPTGIDIARSKMLCREGQDATKVKEAIFASLEGMARDNAKMIDENGDLHITCILDGLDSLYVYDLPVAQRGPVRPAAETNGIHPRLL